LGEGPLKDLALALFVGMVSGAYSSIFIATPLLAQMKEREPDMKKLAARVRARRAKESQKERAAETPGSVPTAQLAVDVAASDAGATDDAEPSNAQQEKASAAAGNGAKPVTVTYKTDVRSHRDGAAKRPQPQNKPRSQRKK
jgi:preprotein translocase subunit SecF